MDHFEHFALIKVVLFGKENFLKSNKVLTTICPCRSFDPQKRDLTQKSVKNVSLLTVIKNVRIGIYDGDRWGKLKNNIPKIYPQNSRTR